MAFRASIECLQSTGGPESGSSARLVQKEISRAHDEASASAREAHFCRRKPRCNFCWCLAFAAPGTSGRLLHTRCTGGERRRTKRRAGEEPGRRGGGRRKFDRDE